MGIGGVYAAFGCAAVLLLHDKALFIPVLAAVIGTDIGAYFAGRTIGGPKIAPAISPSKTWAGLLGGMIGSALLFTLAMRYEFGGSRNFDGFQSAIVAAGALIAVVAQAGDFFESWMKRRARVKDSGNLIPGHGGMFDRVDGLLAAAIFAFLLSKAFVT
jgi:phosphatidate cytidylyltransferase